MGIRIGNDWRRTFIFTTIIGMLCCLFVSRAGLSISMMLFIAATTLHKNFLQQLASFIKSPVLLSMSLLFIIPFASGLWSSDMDEWSDVMRIKLPLLFLPIAFGGSWQLTKKQWYVIACLFLFLLFLSTLWSSLQYLQNIQGVHEGYLKAKVFTTPLQNDHVRYSWLVSTGILLCLLLMNETAKKVKAIFIITAFFFSIYLHMLSARTGLGSLYLILFIYTIWLLLNKASKKMIILSSISLILFPLMAYLFLPTFQNRIKYFVYDYSYIKSNAYLPGSNDGNRTRSLKAGWAILQNNPGGVGRGDVYDETNKWYNEHVPNIQNHDRLYPSSEWLLYGASAGWIGVVLFTLSLFIPLLFIPPVNRIFWIILNVTAAFSFAFDIGLEVQYGVFLYSFIVLWWWKWFALKNESAVHEK
jgi:hypothetical protein